MSILDKLKNIFRTKTKKKYRELLRNCIGVKIGKSADEKNLMRFGGMPHTPKDFE